MTITYKNDSGLCFDFPEEELAVSTVEAALLAEEFPYEAQVSILLVTEEEIRRVNIQARAIDATTDVLSFPLIAYVRPGDFSNIEEDLDNFDPDTGEALLGDVVLCAARVKEQAKLYGHSEKREFCFLILHSMLHLLGYDHMSEEDASQMEEKQRHILRNMQIFR
ncbi:MAG: rRNA maturation RNase YbeY [Lachnospiraceae bacterium]|nr:rRNA maturation RNase YbeY [Lachnospiraceae bacterium]